MEEKKQEYDDPEQSARFIETAERIQAEDAEERFEEAVKRILAPKRKNVANKARVLRKHEQKP
jgi:hypothetical protein